MWLQTSKILKISWLTYFKSLLMKSGWKVSRAKNLKSMKNKRKNMPKQSDNTLLTQLIGRYLKILQPTQKNKSKVDTWV